VAVLAATLAVDHPINVRTLVALTIVMALRVRAIAMTVETHPDGRQIGLM
jgi:hypothetical protein